MRFIFKRHSAVLMTVIISVATATGPCRSGLAQTVPAPERADQFPLTDQVIRDFTTAKKTMASAVKAALLSQKHPSPDPETTKKLDSMAKTFGFADYSQFDTVDTTTSRICDNLDPKTHNYVSDDVLIKRNIAKTEADNTMSPDEKSKWIKNLEQSLSDPSPIPSPQNIILVQKYYQVLCETVD